MNWKVTLSSDRRRHWLVPRTMAVVGAMMATLVACASEVAVVDEISDPVRSGGFFRIAVEKDGNGFIDPRPAYAEAAEICATGGAEAVFFQGRDLGPDQRLLYFRCR